MKIQEIANKVCGHIPQGYEISLVMENGSACVLLGKDSIGFIDLPDSADKTLVEQINDALSVANGFDID